MTPAKFDRRRYLALCGTTTAGALAGCLDDTDDDSTAETGNGDDSGNDPNTTTPIETDATITEDTLPDDLHVDLSARITSGPGSGSPLTIEIIFTNTADATRTFYFGEPAPFHSTASSNTMGYLLDPVGYGYDPTGEGDYIPTHRSGDCWRLEHEPSFSALGISESLDSGQSVTNRYVFLVGPESDCPNESSYRFTTSYYFGDSEEYTWGFEITDVDG